MDKLKLKQYNQILQNYKSFKNSKQNNSEAVTNENDKEIKTKNY